MLFYLFRKLVWQYNDDAGVVVVDVVVLAQKVVEAEYKYAGVVDDAVAVVDVIVVADVILPVQEVGEAIQRCRGGPYEVRDQCPGNFPAVSIIYIYCRKYINISTDVKCKLND